MPYVITTKRPRGVYPELGPLVSRRAVATLEEAILQTYTSLASEPELDEAARAIKALPKSGGTVGPLPDGTVIEVEPIGHYDLWVAAGRPESQSRGEHHMPSRVELVDAFNARQS